MTSDFSMMAIDLSKKSSPDEQEADDINEKVRNALSGNAWHIVLQASCRFITGVLADVSSGRRLLNVTNPYQHLFIKSSQDLKNVEPLQPSVYHELAPDADTSQWIPRFKFMNKTRSNEPALTEDMKINILEQQLTLLIHASRCIKRQNQSMRLDEYATTWPRCYNNTPYCHIMRCIFQHLVGCKKQPGVCTFGFCEPAKRIISHFKNCPGPKCSLCSRVSFLVPAKPRVRRNAVDDVDSETYAARDPRPRVSSQSSEDSVIEVPANSFILPTHSGHQRVPTPYEAVENVDENLRCNEPILTLEDNETI